MPELYARIDGDVVANTFKMTLATEGEAVDGDILSIRGGSGPSRFPLLVSHYNDPTTQLGSVTDPTKDLDSKPAKLRATGEVEVDGEGGPAEMRRDVLMMIGKRHVNAVSVRWHPVKSVRRTALPPDHPHFVKEDEKDFRKRWGELHESWRWLEGSVVSVGADPKALIGRSNEVDSEDLKSFWRSMADDVDDSRHAGLMRALADVNVKAIRALKSGATMDEIVSHLAALAVGEGVKQEFAEVTLGGRRLLVPSDVADQIDAERQELEELRRRPRPTKPTKKAAPRRREPSLEEVAGRPEQLMREMFREFKDILDERDDRLRTGMQGALNRALGRV